MGSNLFQPTQEALGRDPDRHPAVAEPPRPADRRRRAPADPERRPARLGRARLDRDPREREEPSGEPSRRPGEELAQREDRFVCACASLASRHTHRLEVLCALAANADAEDHAPTREEIQRAVLARHERGRAKRKQHDTGAEGDALGDRREGRERDRHVEQRVVECDVVARPEGIEARLLRRTGDAVEVLRIGRPADQRAAALDPERE